MTSPSDDPGLAALFRAHVHAVWRTAVALGIDREAARDVVQEVFLLAHRRRDSYDPSRPARAWLLGITRNVVRHHHRGASRRSRWLRLVPSPPEADAPHVDIERREAADLVQRFVDGLDDRQRVVFVLGHIEGMSAREISELLGIKLATVYARAAAAQEAFARFAARTARSVGGAR